MELSCKRYRFGGGNGAIPEVQFRHGVYGMVGQRMEEEMGYSQ